MTTVDLRFSQRGAVRSVDVAGTDWPLYKIESLAAALVLFAVLAATVTMQTAVLTSAAVAVTLWWTLGTVERLRVPR
ncbi:MAG: hypothetical protein WBF79_04870 [Rhodococcus sp. (in: high G+C Gram-positive bacteria)]